MRWDVEDFLTEAADWALDRILDLLARYRVRANFAVVGLKARALAGRGRASWLERMGRLGTVGYHSWSHSVHPTLAEDLDPRSPEDARRRFVVRERPGVDLLARLGTPPRFFTQPGGNWVPEALTAGPELGLRAFLSEAWNAYLVPTTRPVWIGPVLYWTLPVDIPKGLLFRLPDGADEALAAIDAAWAEERVAGFVSHPTELVTRAFWDAGNFGDGINRRPYVPAPTRPAAEWQMALDRLEWLVARLAERNPEWLTVDDLVGRAPEPGRWERATLRARVADEGLGPWGTLTAAEQLWALARWQAGGDHGALDIPVVGAPEGAAAGSDAAAALVAYVSTTGHLPASVGSQRLEDVARKILEYHGLNNVAWRFREWVRPASALHWDWPIFPPGFRAMRLVAETHRLAWTIRWASVDW
jgi:peptidoglycan/xylan/chitin deacetylase (PgdA/CDA1 family)